MRIGLRKEKAHCKLLQSYCKASDSELVDHAGVVQREMSDLAAEMGKRIYSSEKMTDKHRVALRRLHERKIMVEACGARTRDAMTSVQTHTFDRLVKYAKDALDLIEIMLMYGDTMRIRESRHVSLL